MQDALEAEKSRETLFFMRSFLERSEETPKRPKLKRYPAPERHKRAKHKIRESTAQEGTNERQNPLILLLIRTVALCIPQNHPSFNAGGTEVS